MPDDWTYIDDAIRRAVRRAAGFPDFADLRGQDRASARNMIQMDDHELYHLTRVGATYLRDTGQLTYAPARVLATVARVLPS